MASMATATTTSASLISLTPHPSCNLLSFATNVSFPRQAFRSQFHYFNPCSNSRITNCHSKLNSSATEVEADEIEESLFDGYDGIEDESDEEDAESSVDLLIRFLQSMFKKVSRRAKKASRSVLPTVISPHLVSFAVDGTLLLASLSIAKALLEVVCTLGGAVFAAILLLRVMWAAVSYFQLTGKFLKLASFL